MKKLALAVASVTLISLGGCAIFANPANDLAIAQTGLTAADTLYNSICKANAGISFCSASDMQEATEMYNAATSAIAIAQNVVGTSGTFVLDSSSLDTAVQNATNAVNAFTQFVNTLQAKQMAAQLKAASH